MISQKQSEVEAQTEGGLKPGDANSMAGTSGAGDGSVTPGVNGEGSQEFLSTGRTGRRNALHDILGEHAETNIADLPDKFDALTTGLYCYYLFFFFKFITLGSLLFFIF